MGKLFEQICGYFEENQWQFDRLEGREVLRMGFQGEHGQWTCFAQAREKQQQFVFYTRPEFQVPETYRSAMAEFVTRANYGVILGNFELDFNDGEIRYKTSIDIEGGELLPQFIRNLVGTNITMMDRHLLALQSVASGERTPLEALDDLERPHGPAGEA
jgi:hypothetical protein